jgi:hypothetical protein
MRVYGLLITKDDHAAFGDWCRDQLPLYEQVVCLDGSETEETARATPSPKGQGVPPKSIAKCQTPPAPPYEGGEGIHAARRVS